MPSLLGLSEEEATIVIYENQLTIGTVVKIYTTEYPEGTVCYQSEPQGSYVNPKTAIDIKISLGAVATTYYFDDPILAPTTEEAPDYVPGTMVHVMLKTEGLRFPSGNQLSGVVQQQRNHYHDLYGSWRSNYSNES